ncbi:cold shock domain-containing protein [Actinoplanes subglobosus]|uniref:Cold shock domain-containing protein n=1 Tax=Actinoplanes subglobosus TaxID=1547892 RepID=A0ABV8J4V7_9ACTN
MPITAFVREWHDDESWGVLDSTETPGGCWAHRSNAAVRGYATFTTGQVVQLEFEAAGQDGYAFRAFRFWPAGQKPDRHTPETIRPAGEPALDPSGAATAGPAEG